MLGGVALPAGLAVFVWLVVLGSLDGDGARWGSSAATGAVTCVFVALLDLVQRGWGRATTRVAGPRTD